MDTDKHRWRNPVAELVRVSSVRNPNSEILTNSATSPSSRSVVVSILFFSALSLLPSALAAKFSSSQINFFERKIRPVLVAKCYDCHSHDAKIKGGLALDSRAGVVQGGSSGPGVVPGDPGESLLIRVIKGLEEDMQMPPDEDERLTDEQIRDFERWVQMGVPDPREEPSGATSLTVNWDDARKHWAFQPLEKPQPPKVNDRTQWVKHDLDRFVLRRLEGRQMLPSKPADRRTLIRRVSYTLTGLPPAPLDVEDFVNDVSPRAFDELVDKYLASPHYGERWARHWMDVARYADTTGDRAIRRPAQYPFAWTYRDWLIDAFNDDLPFDEFIKQQLAADHLQNKEADKQHLAALGFLTVGKRFMGQANDIIDDRIDVVTQGFLGLTVACARCHDHKFDPIPTADYYSLHGVFNSTEEPDEAPILSLPKDRSLYQDYLAEVKKLEGEIDKVPDKERARWQLKFRGEVDKYLLGVKEYYTGDNRTKYKTPILFARKKNLDQTIFPQWIRYLLPKVKKHDPVMAPWVDLSLLNKSQFAARSKQLSQAIAANKRPGGPINPLIAKEFATAPKTLKEVAEIYGRIFKETDAAWRKAIRENPNTRWTGPREQIRQVIYAEKSPLRIDSKSLRRLSGVRIRNGQTRIRTQIAGLQVTHDGSPIRAMAVEDTSKVRDSFIFIRGESRNRGDRVPRRFLEILSGEDRESFPRNKSGRLQLAESIADKNNPLTARVIVNRVWQWHFGKALVSTPGDFGMRAEPPTHPELLDWLASEFIASDWSFKELHRLILSSATWQQASLKKTKYHELDPENNLLWRQNVQRLDFESIRDSLLAYGGKFDDTLGGKSIDITDEEGSQRRSIYGIVDRANLPELYRVWDFANPDMSQARRMNTTVPQQALFLMNSPITVEEARNIANRPEMLSAGTDQEKIGFLYELIHQRQPTESEAELAFRYLEKQRGDKVETPPHAAWEFGTGRLIEGTELRSYRPLVLASSRGLYLRAKGVSKEDVRAKKAKSYEVAINETGGIFANRTKRALVRRWTAPKAGEVSISGKLSRRGKVTGGILATIISSQQGQLAKWNLKSMAQPANLKISVEPGETIDFIVSPNSAVALASFQWAPNLTMGDKTWNTARDFTAAARQAGPEGKPLTTWERFAQVLLFGNEMIYLN